MYSIKICHLYPDLLNLSGDRGNIITLTKRMQWRGIETEVVSVGTGETFAYEDYDIIFMGGEPDLNWDKLVKELSEGNGKRIIDAVEQGKVFLAVNGGYQMLGKSYKNYDGTTCELCGALDVQTLGEKHRRTGDFVFQCDENDGGLTVVGFENHAGKTFLGNKVRPLGKVISGFGNNGEDGTEGARYNNVFATYGHGPILPKNPKLADLIIETALNQKYPQVVLEGLDDALEEDAHRYMESRLSK